MAVQPRFFCQFLCPMGAVFALLPVLPFARLHRQSDGCIPGCNACKQQCPVCLKLEETSLRSGECIACEACLLYTSSLISYRQIARELPQGKKQYFGLFTLSNLIFLAILLGVWFLLR